MYKEIEFEYNSPTYEISKAPELKMRLQKVILQADKLGERFVKLNESYLKPGQLEEINSFRTKKMKRLFENLSRQEKIN